jgi:hypothetical protein
MTLRNASVEREFELAFAALVSNFGEFEIAAARLGIRPKACPQLFEHRPGLPAQMLWC